MSMIFINYTIYSTTGDLVTVWAFSLHRTHCNERKMYTASAAFGAGLCAHCRQG